MVINRISLIDVEAKIRSKNTYDREDIQNIINNVVNSCKSYQELKDKVKEVIEKSGAKIEKPASYFANRPSGERRDGTLDVLNDLRSYRPVNDRFFGGK